MVRRETIRYRVLPAGQVFVAAGMFLVASLIWEPRATAPVLVAWLTFGTIQLLWPRLALRRVRLQFRPPPRAFRAGDALALAMEMTNLSRWLRLGPIILQPVVTGRVTALPPKVVLDMPPPGQTNVVRVDFGVAVRGRHHALCEAIETVHPFALVAARLVLNDPVVPLIVWCTRLPRGTPAGIGPRKTTARTMSNPDRRRRSAGGEERVHLRNYRPGDPPRSIHWRLSARARELIVVERQPLPPPRFWLCVDTHLASWTFPQFERMLQVATTLAEDAFREGNLRGIVLNRRSRRIRDRHALGVALDTLAELRHSPGARQRRKDRNDGASDMTESNRTRDVLDLLPGSAGKVAVVDAGGRIVLEV